MIHLRAHIRWYLCPWGLCEDYQMGISWWKLCLVWWDDKCCRSPRPCHVSRRHDRLPYFTLVYLSIHHNWVWLFMVLDKEIHHEWIFQVQGVILALRVMDPKFFRYKEWPALASLWSFGFKLIWSTHLVWVEGLGWDVVHPSFAGNSSKRSFCFSLPISFLPMGKPSGSRRDSVKSSVDCSVWVACDFDTLEPKSCSNLVFSGL